MTNEYSLEYALPHTQPPRDRLQIFEDMLHRVTNGMREGNVLFTRTLLVDDVTGSNPNPDAYIRTSADNDTTVFRESMLEEQAGLLLEELGKSKPDIVPLCTTERGYSSPFFIATWALVRLGYVHHPDFPETETANRVLNILPSEWHKTQEQSVQIVKAVQAVKTTGDTQAEELGEQVASIYL
jgi:hypothetical protein